jgi:hypothetical protein
MNKRIRSFFFNVQHLAMYFLGKLLMFLQGGASWRGLGVRGAENSVKKHLNFRSNAVRLARKLFHPLLLPDEKLPPLTPWLIYICIPFLLFSLLSIHSYHTSKVSRYTVVSSI